MGLLNYQDFLFETYGKIKLESAQANLLKSISNQYLVEDEKAAFDILIAEGLSGDIIYLCESEEREVLLENYLEKWKEKYDRAKEYVKDKGKAALKTMGDGAKKVLSLGASLLNVLGKILKKIGDVIKKMWEASKAKAMEVLAKAKDAIIEKMKSMMKKGEEKVSIKDEVSTMGGMVNSGVKYLTGGYTEQLGGAAKQAAAAEESTYITYLKYAVINEFSSRINNGTSVESIVESLGTEVLRIDESGDGHGKEGGLDIPFVSSVMKKIAHTPPFVYFHAIGETAARFANNKLSRLSYIINKVADGPAPYAFIAMGAIFGVYVAYKTESIAKHLLVDILLHFAVPGVGILKTIIGYTGMALAIYGLVESLVGMEKEEEGEPKKEEPKPATA
jgi:ElaB/YqjD/DUF883 family membrane-anchored ribosome-binding protein